MDVIEVSKENLAEKGFFCYMSKRRSGRIPTEARVAQGQI